MFDTPILFLVFNRPSTTRLVFDKIKQARPTKLFIAADGPRAGRPEDLDLCMETKAIVQNVDWPCKIKHLYREHNLGCKVAVSEAITWFFDQVEEGIILEDDCLPSMSFFNFCQAMLEMYKEDARVMHISGNNFLDSKLRSDNSHYFTKYPHIWGWATWRRAWTHYEVDLQSFPEWYSSGNYKNQFETRKEQKYWLRKFISGYKNPASLTTWDYQWVFTVWLNHGICINPQVNLVKNIGFGSGSHTTHVINKLIIEAEELTTPNVKLLNPQMDTLADAYTFDHYLSYKGSVMSRIKYVLLNSWNRIKHLS